MKQFIFLTAALLTGWTLSAQDASELGKSLTPLGAEKAGNQDGTIPEWTGGIQKPPEGYKKGDHHPDPFPDDKIVDTITRDNLGQFEARLSPGQIAMFKKYPTWKMNVYPTRRSASYPEHIYQETIKNASRAELTNKGNGVAGAAVGIPFPIPKTGVECVWNHLLRFRGETLKRTVGQVVPTPSGRYSVVKLEEQGMFLYNTRGRTIADINNKFALYLQKVVAPARLAGTQLLIHETLDQNKSPRAAWTYSPAQRRVRRAPTVAYDYPGTASDAQRTSDQLDMFNGSPDRYNWELVGKKELIVPYNSYKLHSPRVNTRQIIQPGHINQDLSRYEVHRVWHVEGTLKNGKDHIFSRRTFFLDEDSWQILVADQYDKAGNIWRLSEAHTINYYEMPMIWETLMTIYDLKNGRYLAFGLNNQDDIEEFNHEDRESNYNKIRSGR